MSKITNFLHIMSLLSKKMCLSFQHFRLYSTNCHFLYSDGPICNIPSNWQKTVNLSVCYRVHFAIKMRIFKDGTQKDEHIINKTTETQSSQIFIAGRLETYPYNPGIDCLFGKCLFYKLWYCVVFVFKPVSEMNATKTQQKRKTI